jgi:hypothetical protein
MSPDSWLFKDNDGVVGSSKSWNLSLET